MDPAAIREGGSIGLQADDVIAAAYRSGVPQFQELSGDRRGGVGGVLGLRLIACVPLVIGDRGGGVYVAGWNLPYPRPEDTLVVLEGAASLAGSALHRAQLFHELKREEQRIRDIVEQLPIGAVLIEAETLRVTWCNEKAFGLIGDVRGRHMWDVYQSSPIELLEGAASTEEIAAARLRAAGPSSRIRLLAPDGTEHIVAPQIARIGDDRILVLLVDVTHQFHVEAHRVRFVRLVGHHLRTPLTPLVGYAEILREWVSPSDPVALEAVVSIQKAVADLTVQVGRLEVIAGLRLFEPSALLPLPAIDLIRQAWSEVSDDPDQLRVRPEGGGLVRCDPKSVVAALKEVLENAVRHGRPPVDVSVVDDGRHVTLRIRDCGPEIASEWADDMFVPFLSIGDDCSAPASGGSGLGLALARGLLEATHGSLSYDSPDHTFLVSLLTA